MKIDVHVHPGSRSTSVGGNYDGALVVHVKSRAIDGAATDEVLEVVANAFNVRNAHVRLVRGATSRRKVLAIDGADEELARKFVLLRGPDPK
jgi:uncharacterized protein (TIGR00251 family)